MVKYKWSLFIGALLLISCSDDEGRPASGKRPVRFSSGISDRVVSRAVNDSWDAGDRVGIYMVPHVADASAAVDFSVYTGAVNVPYVTSGSGKSVSLSVVSGHNAIVYPADGSRVNFVAYCPYRSDTHTANANVYKVNVSNQSPSKAIDLIYHKGAGTPYSHTTKDTDVALAFTHQLSKMKISLVPDSDIGTDLSGATVTLSGFPTTADFDLSTGVLSNPGGATASLTPVRDASASSAGRAVFEAIVVPHSGTSYTRTVTFTIGSQAYSYTLTALDGFKPGMACDYMFKFTGKEVVLPANTIHDWGYESSNYLLTIAQTEFNLTAFGSAVSGEALRVDFLTTAPGQPTCTTSLQSDTETSVKPDWITPALSSGTAFNGWTSYALTFSATDNFNTSRTGYILVRVSGLTFAVTVNQESEVLFLDRVDPTGEDIALPFAAGSGSFAVATNSSQVPAIKYSTDGVLANATDNAPNWFTKGGASSSAYINGNKTGTQHTTAYSYTENTDTQNTRVLYIHVLVGGDTNTAKRFKVMQAQRPETLVADGMANCYMVKPDKLFDIPVVRAYKYENGVFTDELRIGGTYTGGFYTKVIWEDVTDVVRASGVVSDGRDSKIILHSAAGKTGNALIGLYRLSDSELVWSWHVWVTDYTGVETATNNGYTFMDRNLGATEAKLSLAGRGLLYQWGRKDPMPGGESGMAGFPSLGIFKGMSPDTNDETNVTLKNLTMAEAIVESIRNPTTFYSEVDNTSFDWLPEQNDALWNAAGNVKSIYDPCPVGWRVPIGGNDGASPWYGLQPQAFTVGEFGGVDWGAMGIYPAAGCRHSYNGLFLYGGMYGAFWNASVRGYGGCYMIFEKGLIHFELSTHRPFGFSVRCVRE